MSHKQAAPESKPLPTSQGKTDTSTLAPASAPPGPVGTEEPSKEKAKPVVAQTATREMQRPPVKVEMAKPAGHKTPGMIDPVSIRDVKRTIIDLVANGRAREADELWRETVMKGLSTIARGAASPTPPQQIAQELMALSLAMPE